MECNRDEAIRARDIAVEKFSMQDFIGAKKFVLKAQQLYPPLEGATQMLAVLDVHIAAQVKVGINECDWYGILQVQQESDDSIIKRQYRRLALLLHPDKNQSMGAEAAFKLVGEAFAVLSDKTKRYVHDSKRGGEPKATERPSHASGSSSNGVYQAQYQAAAHANHASHATPAATSTQAPPSSLTFWTACPLCRMQYQYMRTYLGYQLLCQKCLKPFLANDVNAPAPAPAAVNGATAFTWNNGPFPGGPGVPFTPAVPRRAGTEQWSQAWSQNGIGAVAGKVGANGHARAGSNPLGGTVGAGASAAQAAAAQHRVPEAYQKTQNLRVAAEQAELKRKAKEQEKLMRQQEREAIKKARESAKTQEALQRLTKKREEAIEKEARRRAALKAGSRKRVNKRKRDSDDDDDDEDEDEEDLERSNSGYGSQADLTRKSSRHRRNVAYEHDGGLDEDDDFEVYPGFKKLRTSANGGDLGHGSRMEKGKSVMYDDGVVEGVWGDGGGFGNKAAPVRDNKVKDSMQEMLAEKYRKEVLKNLLFSTRQPGRGADMGDQLRNASHASGDTNSVHQMGVSSISNGRGDQRRDEVNGAGEGTPDGRSEEEQIVVPDPDFHDFDADRTESDVKKHQIWAVFDEADGMPRFYCLITKVIQAPFNVEGVWLEPIHPLKDTFTWLKDRELSIGTGQFRLGDEVDFDSINLFSHVMVIKKLGGKNGYEVCPRRLEVWAIYRDYDKEVSSKDSEGKVKLRYDFVLVLTDFSPFTGGGRVQGLRKLQGYKTLWVPHGDPIVLTVNLDMHKFSHRVPALSVTEKDLKGVPSGCLELDPASTPADSINPGEPA